MANPTLSLPKKNTANTNAQATPEASAIAPDTNSPEKLIGAVPVSNAEKSGQSEMESIKNASTPINSTTPTDNASVENKSGKSANAKPAEETKEKEAEPTKMEIATSIYLEMKKAKGITRKEILERFVAEAKLSKAGASTYFQLIKAKHP